MPSKTPKAEPAPPCGSPPNTGRLPLMNRSRQLATKACRLAGNAAFEKNFDHVQPPNEKITLRFGNFCLSFLSWLKLPASLWSKVSATPSTDSSALDRKSTRLNSSHLGISYA